MTLEPSLFELPDPVNVKARRLVEMHRLHGEHPGICGDCVQFERRPYNGAAVFKCALSRPTSGRATDWRVHWPACGKFQAGSEDT